MNIELQTPAIVAKAYERIKSYINITPLIKSEKLSSSLGSNIYLKLELNQITGAFKIRGVLNHLLSLREQNKLPKKIVAYSTGNHALAMAYAAKIFNIHARIYLPKYVAPLKQEMARKFGAEIIISSSRNEAETKSKEDALYNDFHYLAPSDDDMIIAGAGTLCYEALMQLRNFPSNDKSEADAVFASCGGGGLLAGSYLAGALCQPKCEIHGVEPLNANDAYQSLKLGKIYKFNDSPSSIADGLRALSISERTFSYLKKLSDFHLVDEDNIIKATTWFLNEERIICEPSAAIALAGVWDWLRKSGKVNQNIIILLSGGNIEPQLCDKLINKV